MIVDQDAKIEIGDRCYFNEGMMISAKESVVIGAGCQFGPNVKIFDNNHCFNKEQGVDLNLRITYYKLMSPLRYYGLRVLRKVGIVR